VFTIQLPLGKEHLKEEEIADEEKLKQKVPEKEITDVKPDDILFTAGTAQVEKPETDRDKKLPILLIVEDNTDMQQYIKDYLKENYRIVTALDGKEGFEKAIKSQIDLIISDIMMPGMDGFELCKKLKSDQETSHIPVILLTAKADMESKLEGLELGADDYISKPFEIKELQVRVKNLIEQRQKLRDRFSVDPYLITEELAFTDLDRNFLRKAIEIFQNHLEESDYSVEKFSREIAMSRSQIYRKLQALTGHSFSTFLRIYRIKKAAELLKEHAGNVTEVAYRVGFNNLSYFSRSFQEQFGESPSYYKKRIK
jgi:DNA-binding response OmpR family regulator